MGSIQLWHITLLVILLVGAAAIAGLVYFVRKNSPARTGSDGGAPRQTTRNPPAAGS